MKVWRRPLISISKPYIGEQEKAAVLEVLDSGILCQGPRTRLLEERFAALCQVKHAVAVSSGTAALHLALLANKIGPGDEVITTPFTFIATVNAILMTGATPVLVDIDEETFNIDPDQVEQAVTSRTKAILPVHLYGSMCDMGRLQAIADRHGLVIVEDACQAMLATYQGKRAGSFGTGTFSLYATKNIMTAEGGMITTDDDAVATQCRLLRNHGMSRPYHYDMLGFNFRMTEIQAAIGLVQLDRVHEFTAKRCKNAAYYNTHIRSVTTPKVRPGYGHVWHQYTVRVDGDRDAAVKQLNAAGVGTGVYYPVPAHQHPYLQRIIGKRTLPVAERLAQEVISLPVHPQLSCEELEIVVTEVNKL